MQLAMRKLTTAATEDPGEAGTVGPGYGREGPGYGQSMVAAPFAVSAVLTRGEARGSVKQAGVIGKRVDWDEEEEGDEEFYLRHLAHMRRDTNSSSAGEWDRDRWTSSSVSEGVSGGGVGRDLGYNATCKDSRASSEADTTIRKTAGQQPDSTSKWQSHSSPGTEEDTYPHTLTDRHRQTHTDTHRQSHPSPGTEEEGISGAGRDLDHYVTHKDGRALLSHSHSSSVREYEERILAGGSNGQGATSPSNWSEPPTQPPSRQMPQMAMSSTITTRGRGDPLTAADLSALQLALWHQGEPEDRLEIGGDERGAARGEEGGGEQQWQLWNGHEHALPPLNTDTNAYAAVSADEGRGEGRQYSAGSGTRPRSGFDIISRDIISHGSAEGGGQGHGGDAELVRIRRARGLSSEELMDVGSVFTYKPPVRTSGHGDSMVGDEEMVGRHGMGRAKRRGEGGEEQRGAGHVYSIAPVCVFVYEYACVYVTVCDVVLFVPYVVCVCVSERTMVCVCVCMYM